MKKLREIYHYGIYTSNNEAVFDRFKELLSNDKNDYDEGAYKQSKYCGIDGNWGLRLIQYDRRGFYGKSTLYLTNEQFFAITLEEETKQPKVSILKALYDNQKVADEWLDRVPSEVSKAFFETPYIDGLYKNNKVLMEEVFGIYTDAVEWLLYEFSPNKNLSCGIDGKMFDINTPEEYYQYLIDHEGWVE